MTEKKNIRTTLERFSLRGAGGLVGLIVVAIMAFSFGAFFFGGSESYDNHDGRDNATTSVKQTVWTCSMHPQFKLPKPGKCPICFMDLIPLETGSADELGPRQLRLSETARELAQIQSTPARRAFAEAEIRMVGKVAYDETRLAHITAWFPGRLDKLYANYTGIRVKKGDHLAEIYSPELYAAEEELIMASRFLVGLSRSSSTSLKQSAATTLEAAREKLRLWGLTVEQISEIEQSGKVSDLKTIYAPAGGTVVEMGVREGMYVKTGTRIYSIADLSRLWVMFEAYESDLPWLRYGQQVSFSSPSFPGESFEAIISFIDPVVGTRTRTVRVRAIVDNTDLKLKPDMFVRGLVKSRINDEGRVIDDYLAGKWISPMHPEIVKSGPGSCDVCGMALVPAESLGYSGKVQGNSAAPLLIPASAPMITGKRAVVYVEISNDEGPLFEGREVELGPRAGNFYVVRSGIEEGELVVINGAFKIDSELQIRAKPSMMSPEGGARPAGHQHGPTPANESSHEGHTAVTELAKENSNAIAALTPVYTAYFEFQMALAGDNLDDAIKAVNRLAENAATVDMSLFSSTGHGEWMKFSKEIADRAGKSAASSNIEEARQEFYHLSKTLIELHDKFGHAGTIDYYLTFCPMANNNKGAYWLQTVDTVYNSFYGAAMLRCGEIKKPLTPQAEQMDR